MPSIAVLPFTNLSADPLVVTYFSVGRTEAAIIAVRRLELVDPLTPMSRLAGPLSDLAAGRYQPAVDGFPSDLVRNPVRGGGHGKS